MHSFFPTTRGTVPRSGTPKEAWRNMLVQVAHIAVSEFRRAIDIRARAIVYLIKSMSGLVNRRAFFLPAVDLLLLAGLGELGSFLFFVGVLLLEASWASNNSSVSEPSFKPSPSRSTVR
jgi:hypothetical protein